MSNIRHTIFINALLSDLFLNSEIEKLKKIELLRKLLQDFSSRL